MRVWSVFAVLFCLALFSGCRTASSSSGEELDFTFFMGTYTQKAGPSGIKASGISRLSLDSLGNARVPVQVDSGLVNPSFQTLSADQKFLYTVEETGPGMDSTGHLCAYSVEKDGLKRINRQSTHGFAPCYISVDRENNFAFAANYSGGIAMLPIGPDGSLLMASDVQRFQVKGPHPRQDASHPHSVVLSPKEDFLLVPDLGADRIWILKVDKIAGKLIPGQQAYCALSPASGPRHLSFHPTLPYAYVINELNNTITQLRWDGERGSLDTLQSVSTLPPGFAEPSFCADIHLTPDGRFLYGTNRGHNSLAGFAVDPESGGLTLIGHTATRGKFPRNFAISPEGKWLLVANQQSDHVAAFRVQEDGQLAFRWEFSTPTPVCIRFVSK